MTLITILIWTLTCCSFTGLFPHNLMTQPAVITSTPGSTVALTCKTNPAVHSRCHNGQSYSDCLGWYQQKPGQPPQLLVRHIINHSGTAARFSGSGSSTDFTLTISGVQTQDEAVYYCQSYHSGDVWTFGGGTKLIVFSGTMTRPSVSLLSPSSEQLPGGSATLACLLTKYSPQGAQVSWEVDGTEVTEGVLTTSEEEKSGSYSSVSTLTLSKESWMKGENYSCKVNHHGHVQSPSILRSQCKG
uniref:Ig-like domain-containing protein n=1 Tax=Takifugu rubripes TaxID=31033 RepID=A0A674N4E4_TAKRU